MMTEVMHTPGPWKVAGEGYGWDYFAAVVPVKGSGLIARCHLAALSRDYSQSAADARLIAASPTMLEALIGLQDILSRAESNASGNPEWEAVSARINAARAAIAKATGK